MPESRICRWKTMSFLTAARAVIDPPPAQLPTPQEVSNHECSQQRGTTRDRPGR